MVKGNIDYHEELLEILPRPYKDWFELENLYLKKLVRKNSKFLDVGCGDGRTLKQIRFLTKNLFGIDHNKSAVNKAKINLKETNAKVILAEARKLPFPKNYFDFVYTNSFSNFWEDKLESLEEIRRVLKKEGRVVLSAYSEDSLKERLKLYKRLEVPIKEVRKDGAVIFDFDDSLGDNISEQFTKNQLISFFEKVKMKVLEIKKIGVGYICILSKS